MSNYSYGNSERREQLLEAISGYFNSVGLLDFSFRGAAKAAGVSPMTLVRYFNNRDGLIDELLSYMLQKYIRDAEAFWPGNFASNPTASIRELVLDLDSEIYNVDSVKLWYQLILLAEAPNAPNIMQERLKNIFTTSRDYIISLLHKQGLSKEQSLKVGAALHSFSNGIYRDFLIHKNKKTARDSFELMVDWLEQQLNIQCH